MKPNQGENETFFQRLEIALKEREEKLTPLALRAGISKGYASKIRGGYIPSKKVSQKLANELKVNHDWLRNGRGEMDYGPALGRALRDFFPKTNEENQLGETIHPSLLPCELPILGTVSAGVPGGFVDNVPEDYIETSGKWSREDHYVVNVRGNSMEPEFSNGDRVVVKALRDADYAQKNDIVIATDIDGAVIKQLIYEKDGSPNPDGTPRRARPKLASLNPDYPDHVPYSVDTPIRGIVVAKLDSDAFD